MNATGQKVILNTADVVSSQITAATDGFGEVQVDVNNTNMTGDIGTSTALKVGLLDMDKDLNTSGNIFVDATTIDDAEVLTVSGSNKTMTGTIDGDGAVEGNITVDSGAGATNILTFTGNIGASNELKLLTLTTEATFNGSVKADNIDLAAATAAVFKSDLTLGANDLTLGEYKVVVGTMPARDNYDEVQFAEAIALRQAGVPVPDDLIVDYSHLAKKGEIAKRIRWRCTPVSSSR